jgi:uncharacterized RDD family membrane protein YckC
MKEFITKDKNIGIFAIIITVLAISQAVTKILFFSEFISELSKFSFIKFFVFYLNFFELPEIRFLSFFKFVFFHAGHGLQISYINILFCLIMLGGCILYYASKFKAIIPLQLVFTLVFFKNLIELIYTGFLIFESHDMKLTQFFVIIFYVFTKVLIVLFSFWIIKKMLHNYELNNVQEGDNYFWIPATKLTRIAHVFLDLFFCYLFFERIALQLIEIPIVKALLISIGQINERLPIYLFLIFFRFIYYFIFEGIFGTTPAKIITNTIVVNNEGQKASTSNIFKRTLIRFIPFESLSFITYGWHDTWSDTNVMQLKPTKIDGFNYFMVFLIIAIGLYYGMYYFENNADY